MLLNYQCLLVLSLLTFLCTRCGEEGFSVRPTLSPSIPQRDKGGGKQCSGKHSVISDSGRELALLTPHSEISGQGVNHSTLYCFTPFLPLLPVLLHSLSVYVFTKLQHLWQFGKHINNWRCRISFTFSLSLSWSKTEGKSIISFCKNIYAKMEPVIYPPNLLGVPLTWSHHIPSTLSII